MKTSKTKRSNVQEIDATQYATRLKTSKTKRLHRCIAVSEAKTG